MGRTRGLRADGRCGKRTKTAALSTHSSLHPSSTQTTLQGTYFLKGSAFFFPYHSAGKGEYISSNNGQCLDMKSMPLKEDMFQISPK